MPLGQPKPRTPVTHQGGISSRRGLQLFLTVMGVVMVVAGGLSVVFGASLVPREGALTPDVDSEMRFYAVWYLFAGVVLLRSVPRLELAGVTIRLISAAFFVAGCARILSWIVVGKPNQRFLVLLVIELLLPVVVIPWHASITGRAPKS